MNLSIITPLQQVICSFCISILLTFQVYAHKPLAFNYQDDIRNNSEVSLVNLSNPIQLETNFGNILHNVIDGVFSHIISLLCSPNSLFTLSILIII